jgi:predicted MFS family arabinose efflux permease
MQIKKKTPRGSLIGLWLAYFLYWGSLAPFVPYVGLFYESVGLTGSQIGQLGSLRAVVSFISAIALAFLSDILRRRKLILILCVLGMITALILFPYMASFATLLPVVVLYSIFLSPVLAILDQDTLGALEDPRNYSKVRMGGSFGWGIIVFGAGLLMDVPGIPLMIMFPLHIFFLTLLLALVIFLPDANSVHAPDPRRASLADVGNLLRQPGFALWMGVIFLFGTAEASIINFLFLHIRDLGGSSALMGLSMTFAILGEIVGFSLARRLQGRVGSRRMIVLSLLLRMLWYAFITLTRQPVMILFIQILGGVSFSLIESGSVAYVNERAPRRIGTTAQAVRSAIFLRLSGTVGALIAGALYTAHGSVYMFTIMGFSLLAILILAITLRTVEKRRGSGGAP